jgi:hypothetical protein
MCDLSYNWYKLSTELFVSEKEMERGFWWENLKQGDRFEDLGVDGSTILKPILRGELTYFGLLNK